MEIETAVKRLAKRLGNKNGETWMSDEHALTNSTVSINTPQTPNSTIAQAEQLRRTMGTPDIVVSSISSDEENDASKRQGSSEMGSSYPTSAETR